MACGVREDGHLTRLLTPAVCRGWRSANVIPRLLLESARLLRAASPPGAILVVMCDSGVAAPMARGGRVAGGAVADRGESSHFAEMSSGCEMGSYLRRTDLCITQL